MSSPPPRRVAAVERALALLEALAGAEGELGTNELARRTAMYPSSASRLLATLADGAIVRRSPDSGRFGLGPGLIALGAAALAGLGIRELARPQLESLAARTGETATLSLVGERETMTIDLVQGAAWVQSVARIGRFSVPHATATGKVFLAFARRPPASRDEALAAYTPRTITDPARLGEEIAATARRGWAEAVGERDVDLNAIAAPVLDAGGDLRAIVGLQGPASRFDEPAMRAARELLLAATAAISGAPSDQRPQRRGATRA